MIQVNTKSDKRGEIKREYCIFTTPQNGDIVGYFIFSKGFVTTSLRETV